MPYNPGRTGEITPVIQSPTIAGYDYMQPMAEKLGETLVFGVPGMVAGFADTVLQSVGLADDDSVASALKATIEPFGSYYERNREGLRMGGDLVGMFIPGLGAARLIQGGKWLHNITSASAKSRWLNSVFTSGKTWEQVMRPLRAHDEVLAAKGFTNIELGSRGASVLINGVNRNMLAKEAYRTRLVDTLKENVAFELGVFATMNESDVLYPDDWSTMETLTLNMALPAVGAGVEHLLMRKQIRNSAQAVARAANFTYNMQEHPLGQVFSTPVKADFTGDRSLAATTYAITDYDIQSTIMLNRTDGDLVSNMNAMSLELQKGLVHEFSKMAKDVPFRGFNTKVSDISGGMQDTLLAVTREDPTFPLGIVSLDQVPATIGQRNELIEAFDESIKKLQKTLEKEREALNKLAAGDEYNAKAAKIAEMEKEIQARQSAENFVLDRDLYITTLDEYVPEFTDLSLIKTIASKEHAPAEFKITDLRDPNIKDQTAATVVVRSDFKVEIPTRFIADSGAVDRANVTRFVTSKERGVAGNLLHTIAQAFHYKKDMGRVIFNQLSKPVQQAIEDWIVGSNFGNLRRWYAEGDPQFQELYDAFKPLREALYDLADAQDGTIRLFRGERTKKANAADHGGDYDLASYTTDLATARSFSDQVIEKRVKIDDIVAVVGGAGNEFEFIVKNSRTRVEEPVQYTAFRYNQLSHYQRSAVYAGLRKAINYHFDKAGNYIPKKVKHVVFEDAHHTELDAIIELISRSGGQAWDDIKLPDSWGQRNLEALEWASLRSKYGEYLELAKRRDSTILAKSDARRLNNFQIRKMLNLPAGRFGETSHPVWDIFEQMRVQNIDDLPVGVRNMSHFRQMIHDSLHFPDITPFREFENFKWTGNNLDRAIDSRAPVRMTKRPMRPENYTAESYRTQMFMNYQSAVETLKKAAETIPDSIVGSTYGRLEGRAVTNKAKEVNLLSQGQMRGEGTFTTQVFAQGENPVLKATSDLAAEDIILRKQIAKILNGPEDRFSTDFAKIRAPQNKGSLTQFNQYVQSMRYGWDVKEVTNPTENTFSWVLENNNRNQNIWKRLYGTSMPENAMLPMITPNNVYKPLEVDALAFSVADHIREIGHRYLDESNILKKALGLTPTRKKEWWIPPKDLTSQYNKFLRNPIDNRVIVVGGNTPAEMNQRLAKLKENPEYASWIEVSPEGMGDYFAINDEQFAGLMDYSDSLLQTGKANKGGTAHHILETGAEPLNSMIATLNSNLQSLIPRTRAVYFAPQIEYAKRMSRAAMPSQTSRRVNNVWEHYVRNLLGGDALKINTKLGGMYYKLEDTYDKFLEALHSRALDFGIKNGISIPEHFKSAFVSDDREFRQLKKQLGDKLPFETVEEYVQNTLKVTTPGNMKKHMAQLNMLTSLLTLRLLETGHAVMNMLGLAATMPAVIRALNRFEGETDEMWEARIGAYGSIFGTNKKIPVFHPAKLMAASASFMFSKEGREVWRKARDAGWMDQAVTELYETLTHPQQGYVANLISKYGSFATALADKSEVLARGMAFMNGYYIGKQGLQISNEKDLFAFAHKFANETIGDYRAGNRPRIFQGAVGMPLGLFQTYAWNYFQRIFGYIENKQTRALATQYAIQAMLFGASGVPGFDIFNDWFLTAADGKDNVIDNMNEHFGREFTDWFMYGTLSNIPKLFGAGDGVSLYQRGDANIRTIPGLWNIQQTPAYNMYKQITGGIGAFVDMMSETGFNTQQMTELMALHSINRPIRGLMEILTGYSIDSRGQVISDETQSGLSIAARVLGMKPLSEAKSIEAWARLRATQHSQAAKQERLRKTWRAMFRNGRIDADEFAETLHTYIRNGGSVEALPGVIRNNAIAAMVPKLEREFMEVLGNPQRGHDLMRILATGSLNQYDFVE